MPARIGHSSRSNHIARCPKGARIRSKRPLVTALKVCTGVALRRGSGDVAQAAQLLRMSSSPASLEVDHLLLEHVCDEPSTVA
jgi:hypothetical protein